MYDKALFIIILFISNVCFSQTFDYSYIDPCTGSTKTINVPSNGITVTYYGQIQTFQPADFNNGTFDSWANGVYGSFGGSNPCSVMVGLPTAINITQGTVYTTIGIINSLTTLADLTSGISGVADVASSSTNILGGTVGTIGNSGGSNNSGVKKDNVASQSTPEGNTQAGQPNTSQNSSSNTTQTQTPNNNTSGSQSATPQNAGSNTNQTQGSSGSSGTQTSNSQSNVNPSGTNTNTGQSSTNTGSNNTESQQPVAGSDQENGKTNITAGGTNTIASSNNSSSGGSKSSAAQKESGGKPTIIASSDFVGFNFKNSDVTSGIKATGGYTSLRWDGGAAHGILVDYTSANRGPNTTIFQAWIKPKSTTLVSGTLTLGFEGYGSQYLTLAFGQVRSIKKVKIVYMATCSAGKVYKETFVGTAVIAGGMYDFKLNKRFNIKIMNLFVYAPYVSYLDDVVMKSPYVMIPSIGTNIGITKKFKFNINMGSTMQINDATMNYTITCGTRLML